MPVCPRCRGRYPSGERFCPHDTTVLVEDVDIERIGTTVDKYTLLEILGRGGMGTVYRAEHIYIRKRFAVKVLHSQFAKYEDAVERFLREAQAASSIHHPNIVNVTDFGTMPGGGVYFVMEYLEGTSLEDYIEDKGFIELHRALNITNQMSLALAAAHEQHIVHRDLKPDNIMLIPKPGRRNVIRRVTQHGSIRLLTERESRFDFVKILDFGIAKVLTAEETDAGALPGAVFGTPEYMSPEAARGDDVDFRADIYSVGVILFDMLTGRPPFEAEEISDVLAMHISKPPPSPRHVAPEREITATCEELIMRALAKDPADRHQSMDEFREELQHCYGSVAYRRNAASIPEARSVGPEARNSLGELLPNDEKTHPNPVQDPRGKPVTDDEIEAFLNQDDGRHRANGQQSMRDTDVEERFDPIPRPGDTIPAPIIEAMDTPSGPILSPDEEERLADAVDAALDDHERDAEL